MGLIMLTGDEMAGERMAVGFETKDQEDEQSCFADYSLQDLQANFKGVTAVYGQINSLILQTNPELAGQINTQIETFKKNSNNSQND